MDTQTILIAELITLILINLVTIIAGFFIFKMIMKEFKKPLELPAPPAETSDNSFDLGIENQLIHTKTFMELIQDIAKNFVTVNWKNFIDEYEMKKITESRLKLLIKETADQVYNAIDSSKATKFTIQNTVLKDDFYYKYIILLVTNYIKSLHQSQV